MASIGTILDNHALLGVDDRHLVPGWIVTSQRRKDV